MTEREHDDDDTAKLHCHAGMPDLIHPNFSHMCDTKRHLGWLENLLKINPQIPP